MRRVNDNPVGLLLLCLLLTRLRQEGCSRIQAEAYQRHSDSGEAKESSN